MFSLHEKLHFVVFPRLVPLMFSIMLASGCTAYSSLRDNNPNWQAFRDGYPEHIQDWIVSGNGPTYSLIYAEPPTGIYREEWSDLLQSSFDGYRTHQWRTRPIGFNGRASDLVIELDYSEVTDVSSLSALERDIARLSESLYGTAIGSEPLQLETLLSNPAPILAPAPITISGSQLKKWLFAADEPMHFRGIFHNTWRHLQQILNTNDRGYFVSKDQSLGLLVFNVDREPTRDFLREIRLFTLGTDLIVGGVEWGKNDTSGRVVLVGRIRQVDRVSFPPLRVEEILNLAYTDDDELAQSFVRFSPGAGKMTVLPGKMKDWAPSYLSTDLLNTEFGSLLNRADAILKSQSLDHSVKYQGFDMPRIPNNPQAGEGVYDFLSRHISFNSMRFNFNTVGSGHWLLMDKGSRLYATNRTGSFSVTFSPNTVGENDTTNQTRLVREQEGIYTEWFNQSRNAILARTVQYMNVYQLFKNKRLAGRGLIPDRQDYFREIGVNLKSAVGDGFQPCLSGGLPFDFFIESMINYNSAQDSSTGSVLTSEEVQIFRELLMEDPLALLQKIEAVAALQYEAGLSSSNNSIDVISTQIQAQTQAGVRTQAQTQSLLSKYELLSNEFKTKYRQYEAGEDTEIENGKEFKLLKYKLPENITSAYIRDKAKLQNLSSDIEALTNELNALTQNIDNLINERNALTNDLYEGITENSKIAKTASTLCALQSNLITTVFNDFNNATQALLADENSTSPIQTQTIVLSNDTSGMKQGGHNVSRQTTIFVIDPNLSSTDYLIQGNRVSLSSEFENIIDVIAEPISSSLQSESQVIEDILSKALSLPPDLPIDRFTTLGINNNLQLDNHHSHVGAIPDRRTALQQRNFSDNSAFISWDGSGYVIETKENGVFSTTKTIGATNAITEILTKKMSDSLVTNVELDESINSQNFLQIVDNYQKARPLTVGSATSKNGSSWFRISQSDPSDSREIRIVSFSRKGSNEKIDILDTPAGRAELEISIGESGAQIAEALKQVVTADTNVDIGLIHAQQSPELGTVINEVIFQTPLKVSVNLEGNSKNPISEWSDRVKVLWARLQAQTLDPVNFKPESKLEAGSMLIHFHNTAETLELIDDANVEIRVTDGRAYIVFHLSPEQRTIEARTTSEQKSVVKNDAS